MFGAGCGIRLYRLLTIAISSTLKTVRQVAISLNKSVVVAELEYALKHGRMVFWEVQVTSITLVETISAV